MKRLAFFLSTFFFSALSAHAQDMFTVDFKHFKKVHVVKFDKPDTLIIATIDQIDVDSADRLLITDRIGERVLLFDSTGTLEASLNPSVCHPGFTFSPRGARFVGSDFILVLNNMSGQWGYRFTNEGSCMGNTDRNFSGAQFFDTGPDGILYGMVFWPDRKLKRMSSIGKTLEEIKLPPTKFPNSEDRFSNGGLIADGENIFYTSAGEPGILKYQIDGTFIKKIYKHNSWFNFPKKDLPSDVNRLSKALKDYQGKTGQFSLFELTEEAIMIQYIGGDRGEGFAGYQVFTKDGELVVEDFGLKSLFIHGENGFVYRVVQPGLDGRGELPNPFVEVYQFIVSLR